MYSNDVCAEPYGQWLGASEGLA
eukprot:SAG31_NODE_45241_length_259_cov_1.262500_1_plen_22_part_01